MPYYILFMVKKQIQPHDFENGGPIKQTSILFEYGGEYATFIGNTIGTVTMVDTATIDTFTITNTIGNNTLIIADDGTTTIGGNLNVGGVITTQPVEGEVKAESDDFGNLTWLIYKNGRWSLVSSLKQKKPSLFRRFINLFTK